jgi:hypothetical protein
VIGSYNWKAVDPRNRSAPPTIIVPGVPRVLQTQYRNKKLTQLVRDEIKQGQADENAFRCPDFPLEPLFLAVKECSPEFKMKDVDIISDRNNMRKLLKFAAGIPQDDFEIRLSVLGKKAVVFERVQLDDESKNQFAGFGLSFETWITDSSDPTSNENFRVIARYNLASLNLVIRHEVDAAEAPLNSPRDLESQDLADLLKNLLLDDDARKVVEVVRQGKLFPQLSGVELKTKSASYPFDYPDLWSQMIFSGITNKAVIGFHKKGKLVHLEEKTLDTLTASVRHSSYYKGFKKLVPFLQEIVKCSRNSISHGEIGLLKYSDITHELSFTPKFKKGFHLSSHSRQFFESDNE